MRNRKGYINIIKCLVLSCLCWAGMGSNALAQTEEYDRIIVNLRKMAGCKSYTIEPISLPNPHMQDVAVVRDIVGGKPLPSAEQTPLLRLHGNVAYTFDYRARLDTPFAATNLQQRSEQIYADATLKGHYPFRLFVNSRQSNTPFFKNIPM